MAELTGDATSGNKPLVNICSDVEANFCRKREVINKALTQTEGLTFLIDLYVQKGNYYNKLSMADVMG